MARWSKPSGKPTPKLTLSAMSKFVTVTTSSKEDLSNDVAPPAVEVLEA